MTDHKSIILDYLSLLEILHKNDKYRNQAYKNAIKSLTKFSDPITNADDVKHLSGIGKGIYEKINEIIETGGLAVVDNNLELEEINQREEIIEKFSRIHGIGPVTAKKLYDKGFRSIDDLKKYKHLTNTQKIGLKYYKDFEQRIPRQEITSLKQILQETVDFVNKELNIEIRLKIAGSYRRKLKESGDIDCLITCVYDYKQTDASPVSSDDYIQLILCILHEKGVIIDDLGIGPTKYLGVCKLNKNSPARRIDFEIVDYPNWVYALLYFTGSKDFNTQMRAKANKMGYTLNEKGLTDNKTGENFIAQSEEDVFKKLKMKFLKPEER